MEVPSDLTILSSLLATRSGATDVELCERRGQPSLILRNEFATVRIALDRSGNGVLLVVTDTESGQSIALDPLEIEAIARMTHHDFDERILERGPPSESPANRTAQTRSDQ
jgi:hypothetical protein